MHFVPGGAQISAIGLQHTSPGKHILLPHRTGRGIFLVDAEVDADGVDAIGSAAVGTEDADVEGAPLVAVAVFAGGSGSSGAARLAHADTERDAATTMTNARTTPLRGRTGSDDRSSDRNAHDPNGTRCSSD